MTWANGEIVTAEITLTFVDGSKRIVELHEIAPDAGFIFNQVNGIFKFSGFSGRAVIRNDAEDSIPTTG